MSPQARGEKKNGFVRTDSYRARALRKLADKLELSKLSFQLLRHTMETLAHSKQGV